MDGSFEYNTEYFSDISRRCKFNEYMADWYERMADMEYDRIYPLIERDCDIHERGFYSKDMYKYRDRAKSMRMCMRYGWASDYYRLQGVKVVNGVNRCRDRFCYNCQSMDALQRFHEYAPLIDKYSKDYDVYHIVVSQPNVPGVILGQTLDLMYKSFSRLIGFLSGKKKIKGLDLVGEYGYVGAVRALEVSKNDADSNYHPHFHCMMVLRKGIDTTPKYRNMFSTDRTHRREDRLFSDFEVFLQRIWYLLMNGFRVTLANLRNLPQVEGARKYPDGFSCYAENAQGHYHEVFKYVTKGSYKNGSILNDFECFLTLYNALYHRRVYQTYGCFYGIDMNEVHEQFNPRDLADMCFNEIVERLNELEQPVRLVEDLSEILRLKVEEQGVKYISAQSVRFAFDAVPRDKQPELKERIIACLWDRI